MVNGNGKGRKQIGFWKGGIPRYEGQQQPGQNKGRRGQPVRFLNRMRQGPSIPGIIREPNRVPSGLSSRHHFDAFNSSIPQALAFSVGPSTHIHGLRSYTLNTAANHRYIVLLVGSSSTPLVVLDKDLSASTTWTSYEIPSLGLDSSGPDDSNPSTFMCSRSSIRCRNITKASDVAGVVRAYNFPQYLQETKDGAFTNNDFGLMADAMANHPKSKTYSASMLTATHQWDATPTSQEQYHKFRAHSESAVLKVIDTPGLTMPALLIENNVTPQSYEITVASACYARYSKTGPLLAMACEPPTVPLPEANKSRDMYEQIINWGKPLGSFAGHLHNMINHYHAVRRPNRGYALRYQRDEL